jgi:hypothetical protein
MCICIACLIAGLHFDSVLQSPQHVPPGKIRFLWSHLEPGEANCWQNFGDIFHHFRLARLQRCCAFHFCGLCDICLPRLQELCAFCFCHLLHNFRARLQTCCPFLHATCLHNLARASSGMLCNLLLQSGAYLPCALGVMLPVSFLEHTHYLSPASGVMPRVERICCIAICLSCRAPCRTLLHFTLHAFLSPLRAPCRTVHYFCHIHSHGTLALLPFGPRKYVTSPSFGCLLPIMHMLRHACSQPCIPRLAPCRAAHIHSTSHARSDSFRRVPIHPPFSPGHSTVTFMTDWNCPNPCKIAFMGAMNKNECGDDYFDNTVGIGRWH